MMEPHFRWNNGKHGKSFIISSRLMMARRKNLSLCRSQHQSIIGKTKTMPKAKSLNEARKVVRRQESTGTILENIGDSVSGKFVSFSPVASKDGGKEGMYIRLDKVKPLSVGAVLKNIIKANLKAFKKGVNVTVTLTGFGSSKKGNPSKILSVTVDGKKLEGDIGRDATQKEVEAFFS
jgi:hypothetical protein